MVSEAYKDRRIKIISFDDIKSGEYVVEFVDPAVSSTDSVIAVFNTCANWSEARVSINPDVESVSVEFLIWALKIARRMMDGNEV